MKKEKKISKAEQKEQLHNTRLNAHVVLGVTGARVRNNAQIKVLLRNHIRLIDPDVIIAGDSPRGADKFAKSLAMNMHIPFIQVPANVTDNMRYQDKTRAFYFRNMIVAMNATHLVAFPKDPDNPSGGTFNCMKHYKRLKGSRANMTVF